MKVRITSPLILFLLGWGRFPTYVTADTKLWWRWLTSPKNHHW
jgi:hypothetical protein